MLEELHPIENVPICEAYPLLGKLNCCLPAYPSPPEKQPDGNDSGITEPLLEGKKDTITINGKEVKKKSKKKKKNNVKNEDVFKANPIARLGFGITAYVDMIWFMILAFAVFSVFLIPTMNFFKTGTNVDGTLEADDVTKALLGYEPTMISNIGYSSVSCASIPVHVGSLTLSCPYGTIGATDGKPLSFGINIGA